MLTKRFLIVAASLLGISGCASPPKAAGFSVPPEAEKLSVSGPDSYCRRPEVVGQLLVHLSEAPEIKAAGFTVIDFLNASTTEINSATLSFSCHGIANISNGQQLPGTFIVKKNAANRSIWLWMNDD
ncbi:MAG: hypothetical protein V4607_13590 [Pseudomonadota bacterium]